MNSITLWISIFSLQGILQNGNSVNITQFDGCSCDMTEKRCDVYCCCDQDCLENEKNSFFCDVNNSKTHSKARFCNSFSSGRFAEFHRILCIEKENSPFLGWFHPNIPVRNNIPSVNELLQKPNLFYEKEQYQNIGFVAIGGYVYGKELVIVKKNRETSSLYIPRSTFSSSCDSLYPVQYLKEFSSVCLQSVSDFCSSKELNIETFLLGNENKLLLSVIDDEVPLEDVTIRYFVPDEPCCYVKTKECIEYGCKKNKLKSVSMPVTTSRQSQGLCFDALLEVRYQFRWKGNKIIFANVTIVFDTIPLDSFLSQRFSVKFEQLANTSQDISDIGSRVTFGSVGYSFGDKVIGLTNKTVLMETPIYLWRMAADDSCIEDRNVVAFGVDRISGCVFRPETTDCNEIRNSVTHMQTRILSADIISRSRKYTDGDSVQIIHTDSMYNDTEDDPEFCHNIPDHVVLELMYTEIFRTSESPVYKVIAAVRRESRSSWSLREVSVSGHPIWSSMKFRFISMDEQRLLKTSKRSHLPIKKAWEKSKCSYWRNLAYPFTSLDFKTIDFGSVFNAMCLLAILAVSLLFLYRAIHRPIRI